MISKNQTAVISLLLFSLLQLAAIDVRAESLILQSKTNTNSAAGASPVSGISDVYSDIDMRVRLANKASKAACVAIQCEENLAFDASVASIGRYLSKAALQLYPNQEKIIQRMTFSVAEKQEAATTSNNKGQIVVLRGVQDLQLSDDALSFVIAREMAHVLAGHHKTNTSTKLIISALASVLFPAVAIIGASSAAAQASTATTLLTSAASTATSMVGGEVALAKMKPTQLSQADEMAFAIMEKVEWDMRSAQNVLTKDEPATSAWMLDLETSRIQLANKLAAEDVQITPLVDDLVLEDNNELLLTQESQTQQDFEISQNPELQQAIEAELAEQQDIQEMILESNNINEAELVGVKITPLQANIDEAFKALP